MPFLADVRQRRLQPEMMDDPALGARDLRLAMHGLERLNRLSLSTRHLWKAIRELAHSRPGTPLRVLDLATGAGAHPLALWRRSRAEGLPVWIDGCDRNPEAIGMARDRARELGAPLRFFELDALEDELPPGYDVIMSTLFLHHLTRERSIRLLQRMDAAADGLVLVQDLGRSRTGWLFAAGFARMVTRSRVVHVDAPRSVEGAFTLEEAGALVRAAGIERARVEQRWPFRYHLSWETA